MGKINIKQLRKELSPSVRQFAGLSYGAAVSSLNSRKSAAIAEFKQLPASQELADGNQAEHRLGLMENGNLYSLIGFEDGRKPVDEVCGILKNEINVINNPRISQTSSQFSFSFPVQAPSLDEIYQKTPLPWYSGRSWLKEIEDGISGFARYVYYVFFRSGSRSGTGLQARKTASAGRSRKTPYFAEFYKKFLGNFR